MNEKNDFALVPKPPSALVRVQPGAKRILSGMIADTLVIVKQKSFSKPVFTVLIGHQGHVGGAWEMMVKFELKEKYDLRFFRFGDDLGCSSVTEAELLGLIETQPFDLIMAWCWPRPEQVELFARLKIQYAKPIIVTSGWDPETMSPFEQAGVTVFPSPFLIEDFRRALREANIL